MVRMTDVYKVYENGTKALVGFCVTGGIYGNTTASGYVAFASKQERRESDLLRRLGITRL